MGQLTKGLVGLAKQRAVEVVLGRGRFTSQNSMVVEGPDDSVAIDFDQAIIAAGYVRIELPDIPSADPRVIDSTGALEL